jgi:hypothetical protein
VNGAGAALQAEHDEVDSHAAHRAEQQVGGGLATLGAPGATAADIQPCAAVQPDQEARAQRVEQTEAKLAVVLTPLGILSVDQIGDEVSGAPKSRAVSPRYLIDSAVRCLLWYEGSEGTIGQ